MRGVIVIGTAIAGMTLIPAAAVSQDTQEAAEEDVVRTDPDAIRCRTRRVTGSNARRLRVCMTNAQWEETARNGGRDAATVVQDESRRSGFRGNCPPAC
jgi:hypothetical protein